jgi:hypothetical protein
MEDKPGKAGLGVLEDFEKTTFMTFHPLVSKWLQPHIPPQDCHLL